MLIDEITLDFEAGKGGNGVVRWLHEKNKEFSGPAGGDGGKGGDVYVEAVQNLWILTDYRGEKKFKAEDGQSGESVSRKGACGEDLFIKVPVGSRVINLDSNREYDLTKVGQKQLVLFGGLPGKGNKHFKSFTDTAPEKQTNGKKGEKGKFKIELMLIADFGLIGLPNAGKSSLLNSLTGAKSKVGDYRFTTLDPSLGSLFGYVIADIPGLIEGASSGKGLGHKFLKHIQRTKILIHCISLESNDLKKDYEIIKNELGNFNKELLKKPEIIVLTKSDIFDNSKELKKKIIDFKKINKKVLVVSILDDDSLKSLTDLLIKEIRGLDKNPEF